MTFIVIDLETSGLSPAQDEIIEIGAVRLSDGVSFQSLVKPLQPISTQITAITGIDNAMLEDAPSLQRCCQGYWTFVVRLPV